MEDPLKPDSISGEKPARELYRPQFVPNELVVRFRQGIFPDDIQTMIEKAGVKIKGKIEALDYYVLTLPNEFTVADAISWFKKNGVCTRVEPNYLIPLSAFPNDPYLAEQWYLHNNGQYGGVDDADIDAPEAWNIEQGRPEEVIAVIDTGVDYRHEDLSGNIWRNPGEIPDNGMDDDDNGHIDDVIGWDFVDASGGAADEDFIDQDNDPMDIQGHGTHVAGIIGAVTDNGLGISGVAWSCRIMPIRAGYKTPSGDGVLESDDAAQAIVYAAQNGARVINLSWGDYQESNLVKEALSLAESKGVLICAAAGNTNSSIPIYPAASDIEAIMAIGATDKEDNKSTFSNYGEWVDVSAPGNNVYSTIPQGEYAYMSGTSMSAPVAAGVAALLFSYFPDITAQEVKSRIKRSVDIIPDLEGKNAVSGRINARRALSTNYTEPYIFSITPATIHEGEKATISGESLGAESGSSVVRFSPDCLAEIISWNDTSIECLVPEGARTGEVAVSTPDGISNGVNITVLTRYYDENITEVPSIEIDLLSITYCHC